MKYPTEEQILEAADINSTVRKTLTKLFPEVFTYTNRKISKGELYSWGTDNDGGSGLVVDNGNTFSFVNFRTGECYLQNLSKGTSIKSLNNHLKCLDPVKLHCCYTGSIRGPKRFKSWCTK